MCGEVASSAAHRGHIATCANVAAHVRPAVDRQWQQADLALRAWRRGEADLHGVGPLAPSQRAVLVAFDLRWRFGRRFRQRRATGGGECVPHPPMQIGPADEPPAHQRRNRPPFKNRQKRAIGAPGLVVAALAPMRRRARQRPLRGPPGAKVRHRGRVIIDGGKALADGPALGPARRAGQ